MLLNKRYLRILSHVLFWVFIMFFFTFIYGVRSGKYLDLFLVLSGTLPIDILFTYFVLYFLIPKFLLQKKYAMFIGTFIGSFTIIMILEWTINYFVMYPLVYADYNSWKSQLHYFSGQGLVIYLSLGFVVLLASAIKLFKYWFQSQQIKASLEIQNRKSELALLRSQVNPHFLFNTLNNIDALIRKDPEKASDSVLKLSDIMRYFIYEANADNVPLEKEIDYLNSFIDLQRIRYRNPNFIRYQVSGSPSGILIAPMLFIPFVENAFKHGSRNLNSPGILINLWIQPSTLLFEVVNDCDFRETHQKDSGKGIGLTNVRRRLDLLYPNKHQLVIHREPDHFKIELEISLV